ncbi:hypothetical protein U8C32_27010 (plasmid) [Sinorhizobium medicae]|uniref:hypothetical protein n=1 Tax=Sinorhizobium medicae TaxID=110321 RepID=UPI0013AE9236|nr:hypothetical protein [Sinorhizobium medicae]WQO48362.1 hypothetical protein U8C42_27295 [Sinorhizobium medicae]WQO68777.1 hypothetical protein U8C40_28555 [Sinorhizobium medicae]WQO75816.1 hypothetical protein U8C31_28080 [Sinorhizobium medicae]WQO94974.1 hypothetical protein U8C32_27010 [Sinorhizobium medicae]
MVISKHPFIAVLLLATTTANAADNPMWRSGLQWTCTFSSAIRCERSTDCKSHPDEGTIKLNYQENSLVDHAGRSHAIKRHYVQTVAGSPIGSEVKIELTTNEVIWLSAADGGGTFSDNWTGAMVLPGVGVIVQELRPLICTPES